MKWSYLNRRLVEMQLSRTQDGMAASSVIPQPGSHTPFPSMMFGTDLSMLTRIVHEGLYCDCEHAVERALSPSVELRSTREGARTNSTPVPT